MRSHLYTEVRCSEGYYHVVLTRTLPHRRGCFRKRVPSCYVFASHSRKAHFPNFTTCWRTIWLTHDGANRRNSNPYCRFSLSHHHRNHSTNKVKNQRGKYEYSNSVTKIQVCAMFRAGDIRRNVLLEFIRLRMETPWFWLHYHETFNVK